MSRRPRLRGSLLVVALLLLINTPLAQSSYSSWRLDRSGVEVEANLTEHTVLPPEDSPGYIVVFELPEGLVDPDVENRFGAEVDRTTYERTVAAGSITVRVLPDRPLVQRVEGEVTHRTGLIVTLVADLLLVLLLFVLWRFRGRLRPRLEAVALEDVQPSEPGVALDKLEGGDHLLRGELVRREEDDLELALADRRVLLRLEGHLCPVAVGEHAQVRARLIG